MGRWIKASDASALLVVQRYYFRWGLGWSPGLGVPATRTKSWSGPPQSGLGWFCCGHGSSFWFGFLLRQLGHVCQSTPVAHPALASRYTAALNNRASGRWGGAAPGSRARTPALGKNQSQAQRWGPWLCPVANMQHRQVTVPASTIKLQAHICPLPAAGISVPPSPR